MRTKRVLACAVAALAAAIAIAACGSDDSNSSSGDDGGAGHDGSAFDTGFIGFGDSGGNDGSSAIRCDEGCPNALVCVHGQCEPPQPQCFTNANCEYDSYCDPKSQTCVPYGSLPDNMSNDPTCKLVIPPGVLAPKTFCEFKTPPMGDPFPNHVDVQSTPAVVNFNGKNGPPSIVVPFTQPVDPTTGMSYTEVLGVVRVIRGTDCSLEANLGGVDLDGDMAIDWANSSSAVAVGDLDGDGVAEVVAFMGDRTTVAFTRKAGVWKPLWPKVKATLADGTTPFVCLDDGTARNPPGSGLSLGVWSSPSIHDLDDDGFPEVIREAYVIDGRTGKVRASLPADYASYYVGIPPVLYAMNNGAYLTTGAHIWKFDATNNAWVTDPIYDAQMSAPGWAAITDFNPYDGKKAPEIAVAVSDTLSVYNADHTPFMGMGALMVPGTGGGPPTIADYDGDGLPEVGIAGKDFYTVFDPDCQATPRTGGKCPPTAMRTCEIALGMTMPCPDFELWSRKTQDHSSDITGSSVFDFEASGIAKVVYADECFARVYDGRDGTVLFSQYHSSCTWIENPVVADVDGDFRAELVVPSNTACGPIGVGQACGGLDANGVDAEYTGLRCLANADCVSGVCDSGFCRCTAGAQCCAAMTDAACLELGYACAPPPAGTPGTGNTCRAAHPHGVQGIRVYKDANDRWVRSRTIWNQHAYAVTHVNEDGTVPKTSQWVENWSTTGLNNFRQNVPGEGDGKDIGDLTAQAGPYYTCASGSATMNATICNRGTAPVGSGIPVGFYDGPTQICRANTPAMIGVGQCITTSCTWAQPPQSMMGEVDVTVKPNDGKGTAECDTDNNTGLIEKVFCVPPK